MSRIIPTTVKRIEFAMAPGCVCDGYGYESKLETLKKDKFSKWSTNRRETATISECSKMKEIYRGFQVQKNATQLLRQRAVQFGVCADGKRRRVQIGGREGWQFC